MWRGGVLLFYVYLCNYASSFCVYTASVIIDPGDDLVAVTAVSAHQTADVKVSDKNGHLPSHHHLPPSDSVNDTHKVRYSD